jgi:hypothetical protein
MNHLLKPPLICILICFFFDNAIAQIVINGHKPTRDRYFGARSAITVSYVYNSWIDENNEPVPGYSEPLEAFHTNPSDPFGVEKTNVSKGINLGYEKQFRSNLGLKVAFTTSKLKTGIDQRKDLIVTDKSRLFQLSAYGKYRLLSNSSKRFQLDLLGGPELIYANKDFLIKEYVNVLEPESDKGDYRQIVKVLEVAVVSGLGVSYHITNSFTIFSEGLIGISLPGAGFKISNAGLGLKHTW